LRLSHFTRVCPRRPSCPLPRIEIHFYFQDIPFPKKRLVSLKNSRVIEERIVALEQFIRMCIHRLTHYSTMDAHASQSLRRTQLFLGTSNDNEILFSFFSFPLSADVGEYVDSLNPPPLDDQRYLELMVYR
jgi:hypothetical protein